jgi:hypothetical protein
VGTDAGTGTVNGPHAFVVQAAYEVLQAQGNRVVLTVQLDDKPHSCDSIRFGYADGGAPPNDAGFLRFGTLTARLYSPPGQELGVGPFPIGFRADSGYASLDMLSFSIDAGVDGGLAVEAFDLKSAVGGTVTLSSVQACSTAGSFSALLNEGDGGTRPIDGQFSATYCPTR